MTFLEAQRAARRGGYRLARAGRTPNGLFRLPVCERCGGRILARSAEEAGGDSPRTAVLPLRGRLRHQTPVRRDPPRLAMATPSGGRDDAGAGYSTSSVLKTRRGGPAPSAMNPEHRVDGRRAMIQRGTTQIILCVCCSSLLLAVPAAALGRGYPVKVYFSKHPASDENPTAVVPVRRISPTPAVATFAIGQLLVGPTRAEARSGYYTALAGIFHGPSTCGRAAFRIVLNRRGTSVEPGTTTLQFCRRTMIGGVGTAVRISSEIARTLTQFPSIKRVVILDYRADCFSDLSARNLCLRHDHV
jgi:hypothetical protein